MPGEMRVSSIPLAGVARAIAGQDAPRSPGWHVSALIEAARAVQKGEEPEAVMDRQAEENGLMSLGRVWESNCRLHLTGESFRQGWGVMIAGPAELARDGIAGSLDGAVYGPQAGWVAVLEYKLRFARPSDPRDNGRYMAQVMAYCKLLGVTEAWMAVCYIQGGPPAAEARLYRIPFSSREIDENWAALVNTKAYLERLSRR